MLLVKAKMCNQSMATPLGPRIVRVDAVYRTIAETIADYLEIQNRLPKDKFWFLSS